MKVSFSVLVLSLVISISYAKHWIDIGSSQDFPRATQWIDIKSSQDSPRYLEMMNKLHPALVSDYDDPMRTGRITNGTEAVAGQFPYQVYMYLYEKSGAAYLCGGSIIHQRWILTAAHCVQGIAKVEVYIGAINRLGFGEPGAYIKAIVVTNKRSIIAHAGYTSTSSGNDIGLVELPEDAPIENSAVGILALPTGADLSKSFIEEIATVSGFGRYSDNSTSTSMTLNYVRLPIAPNSECSEFFNYVRESNICLRTLAGQSACSGDSGGPLTVVGTNNEPLQVGIVSFGSSLGCQVGYPVVFARVASFMPWIIEKTGLTF